MPTSTHASSYESSLRRFVGPTGKVSANPDGSLSLEMTYSQAKSRLRALFGPTARFVSTTQHGVKGTRAVAKRDGALHVLASRLGPPDYAALMLDSLVAARVWRKWDARRESSQT